jgi:L-seryl-tRNA(Ser) seleniumtransferase
MAHEPTVQESIAAGVDLALFSGDKLLGGPQAGIIAGDGERVAQLRRHPLARALRVDRMTIAALNATLMAYVAGRALEEIPVWRMIAAPLPGIERRARRWATAAAGRATVVRASSMVGGGSLPGEGVPTACCALDLGRADAVAAGLRGCEPPVIGRIEDGRVLLDPRTVDPTDDRVVAEAIRRTADVLQT